MCYEKCSSPWKECHRSKNCSGRFYEDVSQGKI